MKKIIVLDASPRKKGNSAVIAQTIAETAKGAEVEIFALRDKNVNGCIACDFCKTQETPVCVQKDDMGALIEKIDQCDGIVLLSPVYFGYLNAQGKTALDRMYCFFNPMKPGASIATKRGKKAAVISCCGGGPVDVYTEMAKGVVASFGVAGADETKALVIGGLNAPGSIAENADAMNQVKEIAAWIAE